MFDKDFLWGAASSAYQIEGSYLADGKGLGIWDHFGKEKKYIAHGENGEIACDHYNRFREDVALMKEMGLKSYRFSISWPRVLPNGIGAINEKGLQFYSNLVDELLAANIKPMVTLYHWDLPYELHKKGGWKNPEMPSWFAEYTKVIVEQLSDRVEYWITINEPSCFVGAAYKNGGHAPFEKNDVETMMQVCKNVFLAHGKAVSMIRKHSKKTAIIGMAPTGPVRIPTNHTPKAIELAKQKTFQITEDYYATSDAWWADPIYLGKFPEQAKEVFGDKLITFTEEEWREVSQPLDFCGYNIYHAEIAYEEPEGLYDTYAYQGSPRTPMDWNITPEVMYWSAKFHYERYGKPIMITENGMAGMDWLHCDGAVHDPQRIDFLKRYLTELRKATDEGVPIIGYQYWTLMDNFEWTLGYDKRFGLIYVDYQTQKRTLKDSAYWYRDVIRNNGDVCMF